MIRKILFIINSFNVLITLGYTIVGYGTAIETWGDVKGDALGITQLMVVGLILFSSIEVLLFQHCSGRKKIIGTVLSEGLILYGIYKVYMIFQMMWQIVSGELGCF